MNSTTLYSHYLKHPIICTDTRAISPNCLFFALKGDLFDANQYAAEALQLGAAYAIIDDLSYKKNERYIVVENVLEALQNLARHHRQQLQIPVIGITGSNGKTTSKELINAVLSQRYKTFATVGNLNNHIGVPLSILSIRPDVEIAIIEMGANHQKEIEFLCTIAQPTHGLITNIGKAHLEGFGGFEGVISGKSELYVHLKQTNGTAFVNQDNPLLLKLSERISLKKVVYYGTSTGNRTTGKIVSSPTTTERSPERSFLEINWQESEPSQAAHTAKSNLTGSYNFENILAAICIGNFFQLSPAEINAGIESYHPQNKRSQLIKTANNTLICDYYNANPTSMAVALENLASIKAPNKAMILGDMFELGADGEKEHQAIVQKANQIPAIQRIFIGHEFYKCKDTVNQFYPSTKEALEALSKNPIKHTTTLIKGSRGMKLETLVDVL